ncbi:Alpha-L-rhamnosidase N-terminal domain-containing protein [Cohnella sp. OV330]|uniref:family 78 glycoside hydrolase catalytic domain n=1 Tax=Cohnella sp. OV330 TaxID=1855288 RepID=UPI0008EFC01B|nr:family 78 glycoside hydrolase catalytic domain [Cohnella sp. OV330]SFB09165.1 Alpha-L-rhamnosidase N-terminal domain-containing protein [Cohnella sp. OV330]
MASRNWNASWIWGGEEESPRNEWRCFRGNFDAPATAEGPVMLHITADSRYVLFVNGEQVGRGPVRSWPKEQFFDSYDIGGQLRPGSRNTIAVLVLHFGVSNFYYLRGRGGLIAEVEADGRTLAATDAGWRTARMGGQQSNSPRMACQQAFAEVVDARELAEGWTEPAFDDGGWPSAEAIGSAGMAPWTSLVPRDIPFLTEEKLYPASILSLSRVKAPAYAAAFDLRNQMVPESVDHANRIEYCGYVATVVTLERSGVVTLGFPVGVRNDGVWVDGVRQTEWTGVQPERYYRLDLAEGEHLVVFDVTGSDHGGSYHLAMDGDEPFTLRSPAGEGPPLASIGTFDWAELLDHKPGKQMRKDHPDYLALPEAAPTVAALAAYASWIKPFEPSLYTEEDVFGANVWQTLAERRAVPKSVLNAILPVPEPGVLPVFEEGDCELVIDLGVERSGYVGFELEAPAGTIVDAYGVEYLREGYIQHTYGLENTFRYVCREGRQSYVSPVRRGFRYLILTVRGNSAPVKLHEIYIRQSTYPVADQGRFRCSDSLLNEAWEISRHTTRLCMEDTFVDCPAYEQVFWVGDSRNEALVNYYVFGATEIVERCLNLVPGSADETPLYLDQVPSAWSSVIPNWTFFWILACREYAEHTGDDAFAARIWPAVKLTLTSYLKHIDDSGLLNMAGWNLLDWAPIDQPNEGIVTHQNLFLVKALRDSRKLAAAAGASAEADAFAERADRLAEAINAVLWDEEKRAYIDCIHADGRRSGVYSMQTQVVAYLCGVAEGDRHTVIESYLVTPPPAFVQIGSPFMSFFYYEALEQAGRQRLMLDDIRHNYGQMLRYGATTCWEMYPNFAENRSNPDMLTRSHCHAWSAAPGYFLGSSILGVKRGAEGWRSVEVAPQPCDLTWAEGVVPLPQGGHIAVSWEVVSAGKLKVRIEAPEDIQVNLTLPEGMEGDVTQVSYLS